MRMRPVTLPCDHRQFHRSRHGAERSAPVISAALAGCTILLPVDRRSGELTAALERHGAAVRLAPALTIVPHIDDEELIARTRTADRRASRRRRGHDGRRIPGLDRGRRRSRAARGLPRRHPPARRSSPAGPRPAARSSRRVSPPTGSPSPRRRPSSSEFLLAEGVAGKRDRRAAPRLGRRRPRRGVRGGGRRRREPHRSTAGVRRPTPRSSAAPSSRHRPASTTRSCSPRRPGAQEWLAAGRDPAGAARDARARGAGRLLMAAVGPITAGPLRAAGFDRSSPIAGAWARSCAPS